MILWYTTFRIYFQNDNPQDARIQNKTYIFLNENAYYLHKEPIFFLTTLVLPTCFLFQKLQVTKV